MWEKGESFMPCTEAYKEHIMYTFNGYCNTVIRFAAITHGVAGAGGGKKKYPLNNSQKKSFIL